MTQAHTGGTDTVWTTRRLLAWVSEAFAKRNLDSPKLSAEILLGHVLGCERLRLYMEPDREASKSELEALRGLVGRALKNEPVQYLTGQGWFFGLPLAVDRRVLVPRPCTELMVETVLQRARAASSRAGEGGSAGKPSGAGRAILDLCTGSGCVAVALAKHLPEARVVAIDISADALEVARGNAERHRVRIDFRQGDLFAPLRADEHGEFEFLLANPPYIPDHEWDEVPANVKDHEPALALRGGADGLSLLRVIAKQAADWLTPGGTLMLECAASHAGQVEQLVADTDRFASGGIVKDLEGLDRFVLATTHG